MKVDNRIVNYEIGKNLMNSASSKTDGKHPPKDGKVDGHHESQDTIVHLSRTSKEVRLAEKIISTEPVVREDKVSVLRAKIESGEYKIDNEAIADKLVDDALEEIL